MANILTNLLDNQDLTPILATEKNKLSSLQGESIISVEKIVIKTDLILKKEGSTFYIQEEKIDLEQMNVLDLLIFLKKKGIKTAFINNTDYWYYPALCLLDFCNKETYEDSLQSSPKYLTEYRYFKNLSITPLDTVKVNIERIFSTNIHEKLPFRVADDLLVVERGFNQFTRIIYSIQTNEFTLKLGNKFSSEKIETVSRYLEERND